MIPRFKFRVTLLSLMCALQPLAANALIPAAHLYHDHMPNFWPFYANTNAQVVSTYNALAVGAPIAYTFDGQVINLKNSPPAGYPYMIPASVGSGPMPHDNLVSDYSANAKYQCYTSNPPNMSGHGWPMAEAELMQTTSSGSGQVHVNFSAAVANDVNSIETLGNISSLYGEGSSWNSAWVADYTGLQTTNGFRTLDIVHFGGHHPLGPLVGQDFLLKDMVFHGATLAQPWFLGSHYTSSHGFFPTELSFSERLIPVLAKLGITWSLMGNNHFSRSLTDYPYATYDATGDANDSPPNRADLRDTSTIGAWTSGPLFNSPQITIVNKYPFGSTPHYVRYVDPLTGAATQVAGIPVSQLGEWQEGYTGSVTVDEYLPYVGDTTRQQFFVVAHDGDNSSGRSGSFDTWQAGITVTGAGDGYNLGIDEYLKAYPIPSADVQHVQDGSWPDVTDASTDPEFLHWHVPFPIMSTQFAAFNTATGLNLAPKKNLNGLADGATVSLEDGWHYQEINYAKFQAPLNYAKTAEQIWLDNNPTYWSPSTTLDNQVTYPGNQLNPWMLAAPVKGDPNNNYKGGANPAELAWYFLLPAMDSGFFYFGENIDDDVKPVLAFNNSLDFSQPYVQANLAQDRTGPSVWIPQRYPYDPGSVNSSKAEGYTTQWYNNHFAIYTYAYDVSGIASINVMIRPHSSGTLTATDDTYKVIYPAALASNSNLSITLANVGSWTAYPMTMRDLHPVMNGVSWIPGDLAVMNVLPALDTGNLYYAYFGEYKNQLLDYYIQAVDKLGNISNSDVQQVYVGAGTYNTGGKSGYTETVGGSIQGTEPFITATADASTITANPDFLPAGGSYSSAQSVQILDGTAGAVIHYTTDGSTPTTSSPVYGGPISVSATTTLKALAVANNVSSSFVAARFSIGAAALQTATPTFTPTGGSYSVSQTVILGDGTSGAVIYYTLDGSTPTTGSTKYTAPIVVSASETIQVIAVAPGYSQSSLGIAVYQITSTAPSLPTNLTETAHTSSSITLGWTASTGAASYKVYRSTSSSGPFTTQVGTSTTTSYTDTGLSSGTTYYYEVAAVNAIGSSANSGVLIGNTAFTSPNTTMYLRGTMNGWATTTMTLVANNTWQTTVTLTASTAYTYKFDASGSWISGQNWGAGGTSGVAVVNSGTNIAYTTGTATSYIFTFNDSTLAYSVSPVSAIPTAPANLAATASGTQIALTWAASSGATSYTVYRSTSSTGTFSSIGTATSAAYTDTGLTASTTYYYYVTATDSAGTSGISATASATTGTAPAAPTGLTPTATGTQIALSWTASTGATSYTVYRSTSSTGTFASVGTSPTTSFTNTGLTASTTYYYYVTASNSAGTSANSATVSATTPVGSKYTSPYTNMYLRGTMNTWLTTPMTLIANDTWQVTVTLTASTAYTYKFDASGAWTTGQNWGAGGTSGVAAVNSSSNIAYTTGTATSYTFTFNDSTLAYSVSAPVTMPAAPTAVTATAASASQINLAWTASSGATAYQVYRSTSSSSGFTQIGTSTSASYADNSVSASTTYYYYVTASNTAGTSPASSTVSTTTVAAGSYTAKYTSMYLRGSMNTWGATAMALVANDTWQVTVALTSSTAYQFKFDAYDNWAASTNWGDPSGSGVAQVNGGNTNYTTGTGTNYTFTFNDVTLAYTVVDPVSTTAPAAPTGLSFSAVSANSATLAWAASSGSSSYTVYRSTSATGTFSSIGSTQSTLITNSGLTANTTYYYYVTASNSHGTSANSATVSTKTSTSTLVPVAPASLTATTANTTSVSLSWTASAGATSYTIYRATSSTGTYTSLGTTTTNSYLSTGLSSATTYYYYVIATDAAGSSAKSAVVSAKG